MKTRILLIGLFSTLLFFSDCDFGTGYSDWDWTNSSDPVIHKLPPEVTEYSLTIDSFTSVTDNSIIVNFTLHPLDNIRIDKMYISVSTVDASNPDNHILLYREEYVNFEVTQCLVPSAINSKIYPLFLKKDVSMDCCAKLDNLDSDTEYWLFISPSSKSERRSECIDCTYHPFQI